MCLRVVLCLSFCLLSFLQRHPGQMRQSWRALLAFLLQAMGMPVSLSSPASASWLGCCQKLVQLVEPLRALWLLERSDQLICFAVQPLFAVLFELHVGLVSLQPSKVCHSSLQHTAPFGHRGLFDLEDRQKLCSIHLQNQELQRPVASFVLHLVLEFEASCL